MMRVFFHVLAPLSHGKAKKRASPLEVTPAEAHHRTLWHCTSASGLSALASCFPYAALAFQRPWIGRESPVDATAAVAHEAAGLCIPCSPGLARVAIPTPGATQRDFALEEDVDRRIHCAEPYRKHPQLFMHSECLEVALQQGVIAFLWHRLPRASWGLSCRQL